MRTGESYQLSILRTASPPTDLSPCSESKVTSLSPDSPTAMKESVDGMLAAFRASTALRSSSSIRSQNT